MTGCQRDTTECDEAAVLHKFFEQWKEHWAMYVVLEGNYFEGD